jgi:hypothetical protein
MEFSKMSKKQTAFRIDDFLKKSITKKADDNPDGQLSFDDLFKAEEEEKESKFVKYKAISPIKYTIVWTESQWEKLNYDLDGDYSDSEIDAFIDNVSEKLWKDIQSDDNKDISYLLDDIDVSEIQEAVDESDDLAGYIHDEKLNDIIVSVKVGMSDNGKNAETMIKAKRELTDDEIEKLKSYITGQYSDGWGEGFEQTEFNINKLEDTFEAYGRIEHDDGEESYEEDKSASIEVEGSVRVHFWNSDKFEIKIEKM